MKTLIAYALSIVIDLIVFTAFSVVTLAILKWGWRVTFPLWPVVTLATTADTLVSLWAKGMAAVVRKGWGG